MNISATGIASMSTQLQQGKVAESAQLLVLKKAIDIEASSALALLQTMTGNLPVANSGNLGTKLNVAA
jgi:hypothetical protein